MGTHLIIKNKTVVEMTGACCVWLTVIILKALLCQQESHRAFESLLAQRDVLSLRKDIGVWLPVMSVQRICTTM